MAPRRLLFVLAHPDDESMGNGVTIGRHARAGVEVHLVCATRGGAGWWGLPVGTKRQELPAVRTRELDLAAGVLGVTSAAVWEYPDGGVARSDMDEITRRIGAEIERVAPDLIVGWGPDGGYGHPDHIAVGACTAAAAGSVAPDLPLYHMALNARLARDAKRAFDLAGANGSGLPLHWRTRVSVVFEPTEDELEIKGRAIRCHASQLQPWLATISRRPDLLRLIGSEAYLRVGHDGAERILRDGLFPDLAR